ncbi:FERM and PDZ domain-containing protein 4 [Pseudolycoriella hygida]|uniref:FERM and PDZ domain-containing protein 4 n=1 Tax=Pseudolycoriella hygida TaxID=35572 RepID=A0A9Q0MMT5_9DIPT|nr:FERM and PDZ domain-containing protein 4 [Pseudolycoriella hygida]
MKLSTGYRPKKSRILTLEDIYRFLKEAPDNNFLAVKVAMIVGVFGACRRMELVDMSVDDIEYIEGKKFRSSYQTHITRSAVWLPPVENWGRNTEFPYGWEKAIDSKSRSYYINHQNKCTTYEPPDTCRYDVKPPEPRLVVLHRSPTIGFGFVAGSERPVLVRFVTEGGPSINKLLPGDEILSVNNEDVKEAPREHVIQLVRASESQVSLLVCQPAVTGCSGRKSTLLSAGKKAKLRSRPNRVRFAESVCVNGSPLFPPSAFSLGDLCVPPMANVLKVFLENGQTKSFKYDNSTTVQIAARPGAHKLRCLFRVTFVPISSAQLAQKDLNALDYLFMQCCNDVTQERFSPELQADVALRLAALHIHQHSLANNISPAKLTVKTVE